MSGRVSRVFGLHRPGRGPIPGRPRPIHAVFRPHRGASALAWCGVRAQFRHWRWEAPEAAVTCKGCLRALANNQPRAWRS